MRPARAYARHILVDKPADSMMRMLCLPHFWRIHRYWPSFKNPRSYSEKIWYRMLFERDRRWITLSDKLAMRDYVASRIGEEYLVPLLWAGDKPEDIPFDQLPERFVIKATHGCAYNIVVRNKQELDRDWIRKQLSEWLAENYCEERFLGTEWGYKHVQPAIMIESFLGSNNQSLIDYKFRTFSGQVEFFLAHFERHGNHSLNLMFDRTGRRIPCELGYKYQGAFSVPANLPEMVRIAERLGSEFDFMRIDLYSIEDKIYFGELTPYPGAGCIRFVPREYDFYFGGKWQMSGLGTQQNNDWTPPVDKRADAAAKMRVP